ncbi:TPA: 30S ribosomal protein S27ae [archaeon]|uniref:Small ribosomal subunit protein eS31 n=1 Tax=Candidatus Naiadarchaeum limnaeum TaxID=2756139 RepID=A0A832XLZ3_9ARCH|nr:30S ribosomal protein S27ae [Candidatus Naiadarchaeum limnaeum]
MVKKVNKRELFLVQGEKIVRKLRNCPRCGPGIFLAKHSNRESCGKCGYTEFAKK